MTERDPDQFPADPYLIAATNAPRREESATRFPITIEIPTPGDAEKSDDDDTPGAPVVEADSRSTVSAAPDAHATTPVAGVLVFAAAAAFVIVAALLLARGEPLPKCRDLPAWNDTASCV
ncbi:MAG: hypothetical protein AAGJ87_03040 [Pseudomonadota bacterium]